MKHFVTWEIDDHDNYIDSSAVTIFSFIDKSGIRRIKTIIGLRSQIECEEMFCK